MIDAKEARFQALEGKEVRKIEKYIETAIYEAIEKGQMSCSVLISLGTSMEIRNRLKDDFIKLGYTISISNNSILERGCPLNQRAYCDIIRVSWSDENKEKNNYANR